MAVKHASIICIVSTASVSFYVFWICYCRNVEGQQHSFLVECMELGEEV